MSCKVAILVLLCVSVTGEASNPTVITDAAGSTDTVVENLAKFVVETVTGEPELIKEAKQLEKDLEDGGQAPLVKDEKDIADVVNAVAESISPEYAAKHNMELDEHDIAEIANISDSKGNLVDPEEEAPGVEEGGDIEVSKNVSQKSHGSYGAGKPWKDAVVAFCLDPNLAATSREAFEVATRMIREAAPGINFTNVGYKSEGYCTQKPAIYVQSKLPGCWSRLGMLQPLPGHPNQELNLQSPGCDYAPVALHELLHGMGMQHEQTRADRSEYVDIHDSNIKEGHEINFAVDNNSDMNRPYDILSIMHYGGDAFSKDKETLPTITAKRKAYEVYTNNSAEFHQYHLGQRMGMSEYDKGQLADLYGCNQGRTICKPDVGFFLSELQIMIIVAVLGALLVISLIGACMQSCSSSSGYSAVEGQKVAAEP